MGLNHDFELREPGFHCKQIKCLNEVREVDNFCGTRDAAGVKVNAANVGQ